MLQCHPRVLRTPYAFPVNSHSVFTTRTAQDYLHAAHYHTHSPTAIAALSQRIQQLFSIFNFCSYATSPKSLLAQHIVQKRKACMVIEWQLFPSIHQFVSQDRKYKLSSVITGFLEHNMTKYKTFFPPQVDANKANIAHNILVPVLCVLYISKPTISMRKVQLEVTRTTSITSCICIFFKTYVLLENNRVPVGWQ